MNYEIIVKLRPNVCNESSEFYKLEKPTDKIVFYVPAGILDIISVLSK